MLRANNLREQAQSHHLCCGIIWLFWYWHHTPTCTSTMRSPHMCIGTQ